MDKMYIVVLDPGENEIGTINGYELYEDAEREWEDAFLAGKTVSLYRLVMLHDAVEDIILLNPDVN